MNIKCEANANQQYLIIMLYSSFYTLRGSLNTRAVFSVFGLYANPFTAAFTYVDAMLHFLLSYLPSICSMHIYLLPLSLSIYLSHSPAHTWLSSSHPNIFRGEIIFSVKHPAVHRFTICCKQT